MINFKKGRTITLPNGIRARMERTAMLGPRINRQACIKCSLFNTDGENVGHAFYCVGTGKVWGMRLRTRSTPVHKSLNVDAWALRTDDDDKPLDLVKHCEKAAAEVAAWPDWKKAHAKNLDFTQAGDDEVPDSYWMNGPLSDADMGVDPAYFRDNLEQELPIEEGHEDMPVHGVAATKGHCESNGGLRGHSVGDLFPYIPFFKGEFDNLEQWVRTPSGTELGPFVSINQMKEAVAYHAQYMKATFDTNQTVVDTNGNEYSLVEYAEILRLQGDSHAK